MPYRFPIIKDGLCICHFLAIHKDIPVAKTSEISRLGGPIITSYGVMFTAHSCPPGTSFYTFVPGKLPIFLFIINKLIISNFVLHNQVHKLTHECGFLDEMTWPADMSGWFCQHYNFIVGVIGQLGIGGRPSIFCFRGC